MLLFCYFVELITLILYMIKYILLINRILGIIIKYSNNVFTNVTKRCNNLR